MEVIKFKKLTNFRDLGGTKTKDGRTIKKHMIIRGKTLYNLCNDDSAILTQQYKLKTIIDLRCDKEVEEKPDSIPEGVKYLRMPVSEETILGISREHKINTFKTLKMLPKMECMYADLVSNECKKNIIDILKTILNSENDSYSFLFHCSAGKDRTGIITALLLEFFGVGRDVIYADYLFTNHFQLPKGIFAYLGLILIKWNFKFAARVRDSLIAKRVYLDSALSTIEKEYGSVMDFFKIELNLDEEEVNNLRNKFLN